MILEESDIVQHALDVDMRLSYFKTPDDSTHTDDRIHDSKRYKQDSSSSDDDEDRRVPRWNSIFLFVFV